MVIDIDHDLNTRQAAKLESQEAEVIKRDSIIVLLRAQLEPLRQRQHGASSEKIDRMIEQFELMLEDIEASCAEAEMGSGKAPLPEVDDAPDKPKRKPLPDGLPTEELVYAGTLQLPDLWWHIVPEGRRKGGPDAGARAGVGQDCPTCREAHDLQGMRHDSGR